MKKNSLIYIVNQKGLIGSAIMKELEEEGYKNILKSGEKLNPIIQKATDKFFNNFKPEYVFFPSLMSGGIFENINHPADIIYQNLASQINIIHCAFKYGVKKLLFLGSACSYPKLCSQPIKENCLLKGPLEITNEPFAIAKISGIKMCQAYNEQYKKNFIYAIPTNTYGPNDDFSEKGHVIAGLIRKFHQAEIGRFKEKTVKIWGTGKPKREFIYVDDLARASVFLMNNYNGKELINIGGGEEVSIKELAGIVRKIVGFTGKIIYEDKKPDGIPRRLLDSTKIFDLGWKPKIKLKTGLEITYKWYRSNFKNKKYA